MNDTRTHEDFDRQEEIVLGSERIFGFVFAVVFLIVAGWPLLGGGDLVLWALAVAALFLVTALIVPRWLRPLNRLWFIFGLILHKIVSPVVMGLLFYLTVTPTALIMRILGKTPLDLKFDKDADSYWIERDPPGPDRETMKNQF